MLVFTPLPAPQRRYKIEHAVGAGHFTRAYLATDIESNTKVGDLGGKGGGLVGWSCFKREIPWILSDFMQKLGDFHSEH